MAEAVFLVEVDADKSTIKQALTSPRGIVSWWTVDAEVTENHLDLGFPDAPARFSLDVQEVADDRVVWSSGGEFPPHWAGTTVTWQLMDQQTGSGTQIFFTHSGFAAPDPMLGHTAYTWAQLMGHLKNYAESGLPKPFFN